MTPSVRSSSVPLVVLSCILLFSSATTTAHNITKILAQYPDYGAFNNLLSQTHLAEEINKRKTITVLALKDSEMSAITSKPADVQKMIMSSHVVLDYYDTQRLTHLKGGSSHLTTLFQTTGVASSEQGFLNVTNKKSEGVMFGSAVKGAPLNAHLNKDVATFPYNISVIEVSSAIIAPGIDGAALPPQAPVAPSPAPSKKKHGAAPSPKEADAPAEDETPASDDPESPPSPSPSESDEPADDDQKAPSPKSSSGKAFVSSLVLLVSFVVTFFEF